MKLTDNGVFVGEDAKPSRNVSIDWPAPPEETGESPPFSFSFALHYHLNLQSAFVKPYVFSILPPGSVPSSQVEGLSTSGSPSFIPSAVLEIRSSITLLPSQTIPLPFAPPSTGAPSTTNYSARLLTCSPSAKSPLFLITAPTDRATLTAEGSSIWLIEMKPWGEQVDELIETGSYANALALLNSIDAALLPDKVRRVLVSAES